MRDYDFETASSGKSSPGKGCQCSTAVGFLLVLLAIAIAVGVGLIVHFAENGDREVTCNVKFAGPTPDETIAGCVALAKGKHEAVCDACSGKADVTTTTTTEVTTTAITAPPPTYPIRLPGTQSPISYTMMLRPDFYSNNQSDFKFYGQSSVLFTCLKDSDEVTMHLKDLHLAEGSIIVTEENGSENLFVSYTLYDPSELIIIKTKETLKRGHNYTVEFTEFWAPIRIDFNGLYLGTFKRDGKTIYHISSSFEPTFARMAFPCFDEPALKATFDITISRKAGVVAITNMPLSLSQNGSDGWIHDVFERSPLMSTYLVVFIVGDFTSTSVDYKGRFPISLWSRDELAIYRNYTLEICPILTDYFENFFGVEYNLPKQDQVAMLSFPSWAMENWGAIIYLEQYSLYQEGVTSALNKHQIVEVVAHELSHNWFGNLVSPEWWDDIWLNEAFATFMQFTGVDVIAPEWKPFDIFMTIVATNAVPIDEKVSSHPVYVEGLEKTNDIYAVFDPITYSKGGHLVRMLAKLVGNDSFAKGMQRYMAKHAYGNARHQDLWEALQAEANSNLPNIPAMMNTWIYQMGFPTVNVNFTEEGKLLLTQSRYLKDRTAPDPGIYKSNYGYRWNIPFTYTSNLEKKFDLPGDVVLMNYTDDAVAVASSRIPSPRDDNWVIGNLQNLAFLQVNYDQRNWDAIIKQLKTDHTVIHPTNRLQLIKDSWNLAKSGDLDFATALRCAEYMENEREYGPWAILAREWDYIGTMIHDKPQYGSFHNYVLRTISRPYAETSNMSTANMGLSEILMKTQIMKIACEYGVPECIQETTSLFASWVSDPQNKPSGITADLSDVIYCNGVRYGGADEWKFMLEVYKNSSLQSETQQALAAMACSRHKWLLAKYTSLLLNDDVIAPSDIDDAFNLLAQISSEPQLLWDWMRDNFDTFVKTQYIQYAATSMNRLAKNFNTEQRLKELETFIKNKQVDTHPLILDAVATVRANKKWMTQSLPVLETWLTDNGY